ncbi:putative bifunctional inhibitor/plant lipid transfer protein/seed storage helical [Helianthus annuus]|uniref:Bifunctional inhibitor/plant lipid transfer protein/seed storage helical n=1 Tax=Helianthus annuus TaxID=4232 RepID=A0A251SW34_HELAN|nr:uncharacterized protein LOC110903375 [Helianthus annuus]KAF5775019.1 putative bifunctional inhibitor/plant lipid transfer protein/seed storage helical [Helianthus annuus]KAJ0478231.1 putative bifunctional inhibitor/plant lipid transfer protein/seed storage helical [Helianthus annuus]KAJ0499115.1 putative bifunctional inhibitor/plant lipid transfer protein/seed storage helical [Helianthus annuus]KAJ0665129.1 putative bifunctional inhibitor/plant lipid transfer protein/seed storage helical [He
MGGGVTIMMVAMMMVLAISGLNASKHRAGPSAAQCHNEKQLAVNACSSVLQGGRPSAQCCRRVRVTHAKCICPDVTPELVRAVGGIARAVRLITSCGRKVPHHFKCGSVTTP